MRSPITDIPDDYNLGGVTSVRKQIGMAVPPYGAKLIFEMLLVALADSPSLKIMSDVEPKKATFWKHPIQWHDSNITSLIDDLSEGQIQEGRLMILIPNLATIEIDRFEGFLNLCISKNCFVQCILNDAWKDGIETTLRDMLVELQESSSLFSVRSSFIKGNNAMVMFQDKKGTLNSIYASAESTDMFFQMKEISFNETLALHIETLFKEEHFIELPSLSGIGTTASRKKKIESDLSKYNQLASHRSRIPANMPNPTESIDMLELARRSPVSSFNLEFGRGRRRDGSAGPRRWTEIELTIGTRYPKLPNEFEAHTHDGKVLRIDGKVLKLKRSGGSAKLGKDLATEGNRHLFGVWMKGLLYQSGALRKGERITEATFEKYGKTTLDFYKIDENVFFLDFEPKPDKIG